MSLETEARAYFEAHHNCAQSTFAPFAKKFGMDVALALKIATPFGGGMGHAGGVCGAVSGALLAIGLYEGITFYDNDKKYACYAMAQAFQEQFTALHGDLTCPGLLGLDIGDPEELQEVRDRNLFHTLCPNLVGDSARIVAELLGIMD